jgi:hypothetical protein
MALSYWVIAKNELEGSGYVIIRGSLLECPCRVSVLSRCPDSKWIPLDYASSVKLLSICCSRCNESDILILCIALN